MSGLGCQVGVMELQEFSVRSWGSGGGGGDKSSCEVRPLARVTDTSAAAEGLAHRQKRTQQVRATSTPLQTVWLSG